ncbi:MAG: class I mannose-6-phosphate isomerase [Acidobacteria bacterium]|nr:class I mannose-6-phosphate isomerase [Acidobacteriota bacterium]
MSALYPLRLQPALKEKIWGSRRLSPFFRDRGGDQAPIGEAWYTFEEAVIDNGELAGRSLLDLMAELGPRLLGDAHLPRAVQRCSVGEGGDGRPAKPYFPILSKLLFVGEALSVQVHPNDEYALANEGGPGKTEMWYIADAEPGAAVALGLTEPLPRERLVEAAHSGEIEKYLNWEPVQAGDVVFVPPGLLHTMGPGLTICEIQQNSDLTYRFFDFGRPGPDGKLRALHVHEAAAVMLHDPWPGPPPRIRMHHAHVDRELLAGCPYFASELLSWDAAFFHEPDRARFQIVIVLSGEGTLDGEPYGPGDGFVIPAYAEPFEIAPRSPSRALVAYEPDLERLRSESARAGATPADIARALMD